MNGETEGEGRKEEVRSEASVLEDRGLELARLRKKGVLSSSSESPKIFSSVRMTSRRHRPNLCEMKTKKRVSRVFHRRVEGIKRTSRVREVDRSTCSTNGGRPAEMKS